MDAAMMQALGEGWTGLGAAAGALLPVAAVLYAAVMGVLLLGSRGFRVVEGGARPAERHEPPAALRAA